MLTKLRLILTSKKFYITIGTLIGAGIALVILMDTLIMPAYTKYNKGVTVPNISRVSLEEAKERLESYGLRYEIADRRSNSAFPVDYVIDQTPEAATIVKPDRKVYLTVNAVSNPTVEVPDVVNLSLRNARIQLEHNGLKVGVVSYEPSRFKNTVLRQSIPSEDIVPQNSTIDLVVSDGLGEKTIEIPNIRGLRLSEAQRQLQKAGIRIEALQFKPSREEEPNVILDYEPHKKELSEGENIKLIVSERYDAEEESEAGAIIDTTNNNSSSDNDN